MGLFNSSNGSPLTPKGVGGGPTDAQKQLFANAAQDSGLAAMGMNMVDQMTGGQGMQNEDQVKLLYQLMAAHPNQVALFFHDHPYFLPELVNMIGLVVRRELFAIFNSDMIPAVKVNKEHEEYQKYSSITQENIDTQLSKVLPPQNIQMAIQNGDMQAMQLMNGHNQNMMMQQQQQQQMLQQQMYQQQMMGQQMPQRGFGDALAGFGSSLIRGSLGLPAVQPVGQQPMMGQQPMQGYPQQY
tara:strand:+ start:3620 stop:4342 length:723 start_codon:yes stop_codon:yes gene_type:complete